MPVNPSIPVPRLPAHISVCKHPRSSTRRSYQCDTCVAAINSDTVSEDTADTMEALDSGVATYYHDFRLPEMPLDPRSRMSWARKEIETWQGGAAPERSEWWWSGKSRGRRTVLWWLHCRKLEAWLEEHRWCEGEGEEEWDEGAWRELMRLGRE